LPTPPEVVAFAVAVTAGLALVILGLVKCLPRPRTGTPPPTRLTRNAYALASTLLVSLFLLTMEIARGSYYSDCTVSESVYGTAVLLIVSSFTATALLFIPYVLFAGLPGYFGLKRALQIEAALLGFAVIWLIVDVATRHPLGIECARSSSF
jgi:hypothetical protein